MLALMAMQGYNQAEKYSTRPISELDVSNWKVRTTCVRPFML